jgi:hypothetical protein
MRKMQALIAETNQSMAGGARGEFIDDTKLIDELEGALQEAAHSRDDPKESHRSPRQLVKYRLTG